MNPSTNLSGLTRSLHWIIAFSMLCLLAIGFYMAKTETYTFYPWHKSFGILVFPVAIGRIIWRWKEGWPEPVASYHKTEQVLAKITHAVLIIATVLMPLSGMMFSAMSGHGFSLFDLTLVSPLHSPTHPAEVIPRDAHLSDVAQTMHQAAGWIMLLAICLHVLGALKHHFIDKDTTLTRMLGKE